MNAKAIIWDGSFGDTTLPVHDIRWTRPVEGAIYDWASDTLPLGPIGSWPSLVDGQALSSDSGSPSVILSGGVPAVRLSGTSDRMRIPFAFSGAHTLFAVFRFTSPPRIADTVIYGHASQAEGAISLGPGIDAISGHSAGKYIISSPAVPGDTDWHIVMLTIDGTDSALRIDARETLGSLPLPTRSGLTLGFSGAAGGRTAIEYRRVGVIPGPMTASRRISIAAQLAGTYLA